MCGRVLQRTGWQDKAYELMKPDKHSFVENQKKQRSLIFLRFRYVAASLIESEYERDGDPAAVDDE